MTRARLALRIASVSGREDWVALRLQKGKDEYPLAQPIFGKSNLIFTLVQADALAARTLEYGRIGSWQPGRCDSILGQRRTSSQGSSDKD